MKNALLVFLTFILAAALTAGCGVTKEPDEPNNEGAEISVDEDVPAQPASPAPPAPAATPAQRTKGWPTAYLPPGIPEYPNGIVSGIEVRDEEEDVVVFVSLIGTDEETLQSYYNTMEAAGWERGTSDRQDLHLFESLSNGDLLVSSAFEIKTGLVSFNYRYPAKTVTKPESRSLDWPDLDWTDLPAELPEYTDGNLDSYNSWYSFIEIEISNTSNSAFEKYLEKVVKAGWERDFTNKHHDYIHICYKKDEWTLFLLYREDNKAIISAEM